MRVVPAGVHQAGILRFIGKLRFLRHLQRVRVRPNADHPAGLRAAHDGDRDVLGGREKRDVLRVQRFPNHLMGFHLVPGRLRKPVKPLVHFRGICFLRKGFLQIIHVFASIGVRN